MDRRRGLVCFPRMNGACMTCMGTCGSGVKTIGIMTIRVLLMMGVLGLKAIENRRIGCCAAVPGKSFLCIAVLLVATSTRAVVMATTSVFGFVASRRGLSLSISVLRRLALSSFLALSFSPQAIKIF